MEVPKHYIRTKADRLALDQGCTFDERAAERVIRFVEGYLVLETGKPFLLLDWQKDILRQTFGWKRPDGLRRIKTLFLTCARQNGKSFLATAILAYMLLADEQQSPFCVSCATTREQAGIIYRNLEFSITKSAKLKKSCHTIPSKKEILYPKRNGRYRSFSSDAKAAYGQATVCCLYDELAFHQTDALYTALKDSGVARPNSLQVVISTAGHKKNTAFHTLYRYAKAVLAGEETDTTFLPFVYEVPADADLDEEKTWHMANPSLGVAQSVEEFRADWNKAKFDTAETLNFKKLRFNQWVEAANCWIPLDRWDQCKAVLPDLRGKPCYVGLDAGATQDLTAVVAVFPLDGKFYVVSKGFVPEKAVERRDKMNLVRYQQFTVDGHLQVTRGDATDFNLLKRYILDLRDKYQVQSVTVDKWNAVQLSNELMQEGLTVFQFPQIHSYFNEPTKQLERLVLEGKLVHDGDSLLRWQVGHTFLDLDGKGLVKPITASDNDKRDNLVALVMALSQAVQHDSLQSYGKSVYEDRGLTTI